VIGCFFISAKYEEIYPPPLEFFLMLSHSLMTKDELIQMEYFIIREIQFELNIPTVYIFMEHFLTLLNMKRT